MQNTNRRDPLTHRIIGAAIEVHRTLGPGLTELLYEEALCIELAERNMKYERQKLIEIDYKGHDIGTFRPDIIVSDRVILELKSVKELLPVHEAQLLCYLRLTGIRIGLLINFNVAVLREGKTNGFLTFFSVPLCLCGKTRENDKYAQPQHALRQYLH